MRLPQGSSTPLGLLMLLLLLLLAARGRGLRLSGVLVPRVVVSGSSVQLVCNYEQSNERHDPLYSLKWYRDVNQFYEYIPKREPQVRVYNIPYINVDVIPLYLPLLTTTLTGQEEASSQGAVRLTGLTRAASGMFRCEVMSDKPYFETDDKAENMTVVDVPAWGPELMGVVRTAGVVGGGAGGQTVQRAGGTKVRPGDVLAARCQAGPSLPPANITWTLNHAHLPMPHARIHHTQHTDQNGRKAQMSELEVEVQESWLGRGYMTLFCHITLSHVYHRSANLTLVHADHPQPAGYGWFSSGKL
ncbi:hypothetical protein GWK47_038259 [Chionoecetes opilio]|uniref:Ig-like domain-containing protein n=1 Tax=Chionoecetes opilio TaxID=41210 RepID=A0A8J4YE91_CHIOP|nr:hypothetical protein GWK47_038259 [Chionoecetes opilio]